MPNVMSSARRRVEDALLHYASISAVSQIYPGESGVGNAYTGE